jgi:hypothetical protein
MRESDHLLDEAHRFLERTRQKGAELDGTDESVMLVQGLLEAMAERDVANTHPEITVVACLAYSVYLAELLANTCRDVRVIIDGEGSTVGEVIAVQGDGGMAMTLSWVRKCLDNPGPENVVFKYCVQLRQFGEHERARALYQKVEESARPWRRFFRWASRRSAR